MGVYHFFKEFYLFIIANLYPLCESYTFFVFSGIFSLENTLFGRHINIVIYIIFNLLVVYKVVLYMEIYTITLKSTKHLFPYNDNYHHPVSYTNINPFVLENILSESDSQIVICDECHVYKPPRTHHCRQCNRCYLKMDHHCYILNCCIGFQNYKYFYQWLILNLISSGYYVAIILTSLIVTDTASTRANINYGISLGIETITFVLSLAMVIQHTILISRNETTIEANALNRYIEGDMSYHYIYIEGPVKNCLNSTDRKVLNPYNIGIKQNWIEVFGDDPIGWFRTNFTSRGNGIKFKTNYKEEDENLLIVLKDIHKR